MSRSNKLGKGAWVEKAVPSRMGNIAATEIPPLFRWVLRSLSNIIIFALVYFSKDNKNTLQFNKSQLLFQNSMLEIFYKKLNYLLIDNICLIDAC